MKKDLNLIIYFSSLIALAETIIFIYKKQLYEAIDINFINILRALLLASFIIFIIFISSFFFAKLISIVLNRKISTFTFLAIPAVLYYLSWCKHTLFYSLSYKQILSSSKLDLSIILISSIMIFLGFFYALTFFEQKLYYLAESIKDKFLPLLFPLLIIEAFLLLAFFHLKLPNIFYKLILGSSLIIFIFISYFSCQFFLKKDKRIMLILNLISLLIVLLNISDNPKGTGKRIIKDRNYPNIIILTIDALRRDYLSCYEGKAKTPNIDKIAQEGVLFEQARSTSSWTFPAFSSIVSSLYPSAIGQLNSKGTLIVPFSLKTFPEILKEQGYDTYMFTSPVIDKRSSGISQGISNVIEIPHFEWYQDEFHSLILIRGFLPKTYHWGGDYINFYFKKYFPKFKEPFFVWLHYLDTHTPYIMPELINNPTAKKAALPLNIRDGTLHLTHWEKEEIKKFYAKETEYVDGRIGEIINLLKKSNLYEKSIIIVIADHGEEFWDHGNFMHGHTLYDELLRIPFIIKFPKGYLKNVKSNIKASLLDIAPTLLGYLNLPSPYKYQGINLLEAIKKPNKYDDRILFAENTLYYNELKAVIYKNYKLILSDDKIELYDLNLDPQEKVPLKDQDKIKELANLIFQWQKGNEIFRIKYNIPISSEKISSPELQEMLKALGYVR